MLNIDDFIKRLELLLDYYTISASAFADKLGVQRSGLSHLLSGRNEPSLDFVMKIVESFPEVDLYWLLDGTGSFPKSSAPAASIAQSPTAQPGVATKPNAPIIENVTEPHQNVQDLFSAAPVIPNQNSTEEKIAPDAGRTISISHADEIERIVVFYKNGVFKNYNPSQ